MTESSGSDSYERSHSSSSRSPRSGSPRSGSRSYDSHSPSESRSRSPSSSRSPRSGSRRSGSRRSGSGSSRSRSRSPASRRSGSSDGSRRSRSRSSGTSESRRSYTPSGDGDRRESFSGSRSSQEESPRSTYSPRSTGSDYSESMYSESEISEPEDEGKMNFASLPQASAYNIKRAIDDEYANTLQIQIDSFINHIIEIQKKEVELFVTFGNDIKQEEEKKHVVQKEEKKRKKHIDRVSDFREERMRYREFLYEAIQDRNDLLESREIARLDERRAKNRTDRIDPYSGIDFVLLVIFLAEIALLILYIIFMDFTNRPVAASPEILGDTLRAFDPTLAVPVTTLRQILLLAPGRTTFFYNYSIDIGFMVFLGFALIASFLRKYNYTSLASSLLVSVFAFQWGLLWNGFFDWAANGNRDKIDLEYDNIILGLYNAAAAVIAYGGLVGRLNTLQALVLSFFVSFFFSLNYYIGILELNAADWGGASHIHLFAGLFGFFASAIHNIGDSHKHAAGQIKKDGTVENALSNNQRPSYFGDTVSLFGLLILWIFIPSFNAAFAPAGAQYRVIFNTILSLTVSTAFVFLLSWFFGFRHFRAFDIQEASLSGGIAMASGHSVLIEGWGAMIVGLAAGIVTWIGVRYVVTFLNNPRIHFLWGKVPRDTRGVLFSHALPGLVGALGGIIAIAAYEGDTRFGTDFDDLFQEGDDQAERNVYCWLISMGIGIMAGIVVGFVLWILERLLPVEHLPHKRRPVHRKFHDETTWRELPLDIDW